jgi:hypothetical protein
VNGGSVTVTTPPPATVTTPCAQIDIACGIRSLFTIAGSSIQSAFSSLFATVANKQPFASIAASGPLVLVQLQRATAAVGSTNNCPGLDMQLPLNVVTMTAPPVNGRPMPTPPVAGTSIPGVAGRTTGPFVVNVLKCSTFEDVTSQWSWWSVARTAMDGVIYLAYGYSLLLRWQPKPQLTA